MHSKDRDIGSIQVADDLLHIISNGSIRERMGVARGGGLPVGIQHALALDPKVSVRAELASNANLEDSTLELLIVDKSWRVRLLTSEHARCGHAVLETAITSDSHWEVRLKAVWHANANRGLWLKASKDTNRHVRTAATERIAIDDVANFDDHWPISVEGPMPADVSARPMLIDPLWYWFYQDYVPPEHQVVEPVARWMAPSALGAPVGLKPWSV